MPDSPRILLLSGRLEVRGSCAYTLRLAEHLPEQGFQTRVVCPNARVVEAVRRQKLQIEEYPYLDWRIYNRWVIQRLLKDLRQSGIPDLIHLQSRRVLKQGKWLAEQLNRPYILTVHDYLAPHEQVLLNNPTCARVITVSESVRRDFITRTRFPAELVEVIPSGVEIPKDPRQTPILDPHHVPVVGTAGPLESVKGLPFFLGAAARVLETHRDVEFLIAGAGPEEANLRRLARELGLAGRVTFVPYLLDFADSLRAMDIFCLPSLQQGLGTTMLQAMAQGIPVIASRVGGLYSLLHDRETGLLVPPADSRQLAERILELLQDPIKARNLGENGREMVQRDFGLERMVTQTVALYRDVLAKVPGAATSTAL